jgi:hypothetical protein
MVERRRVLGGDDGWRESGSNKQVRLGAWPVLGPVEKVGG